MPPLLREEQVRHGAAPICEALSLSLDCILGTTVLKPICSTRAANSRSKASPLLPIKQRIRSRAKTRAPTSIPAEAVEISGAPFKMPALPTQNHAEQSWHTCPQGLFPEAAAFKQFSSSSKASVWAVLRAWASTSTGGRDTCRLRPISS